MTDVQQFAEFVGLALAALVAACILRRREEQGT